MKLKKYFKVTLLIIIILIPLVYITSNFIFRGDIKIKLYNNTFSEQRIWLTPKDKYTYTLSPGEKIDIKYSTKHFTISLLLNYLDSTGNPKSILLSEYVEKHEQGTVILKMTQSTPNEEIDFEILNKIK